MTVRSGTSMALLDIALEAQKRGQLGEAEQLYRSLIAADPGNFDALHMLGIVCFENRKPQEAEQFFLKALSVNSEFPPLYHHYGLFLAKQNRFAESVEQFDKALKLFDRFAPVYGDRGISLMELGRLDESLASHNTSVSLAPTVPMAFYNRANTLFRRGDYDLALADYDRAIWLRVNYADAYCGRGNVLQVLGRRDDALIAYGRALALAPDLAEARLGRGNVFRDLGRHAEAFTDYDRAFTLKPQLPGVEGDRLLARIHLCDWRNFTAEREHLVLSVREGKRASAPFPFVVVSLSAQDQSRCARLWAEQLPSPAVRPARYAVHGGGDRIRVGYVSADFRQHAVCSLAVGLFERHDKTRFDVTAFSLGPDDGSDLRRRVAQAAEHFVDLRAQTDDQICNLIQEREIDILVDMMGYTAGSRTGIFARRPAPLQINYLGYPGTMGASFIDYIIADRTVIPENEHASYAEAIAYLPDSFMPGDRDRAAALKTLSRAEVGLPERGFVFCSFNNSYKITPEMFGVWAEILKDTADSMLWLFADNDDAARNLKTEAVARGVDVQRLILAPWMPLAEHRARMGLADLFLDTSPYGGGATASDALWAGLPVLTRVGGTFVGRMSASLLRAVGLPELVMATLQDYRSLAGGLAGDPARLGAIRKRLADNRLTTPLFDTARYTAHIEAAYITMWQRYQRGESPLGFAVAG
jgi:protein O-GlcNAc transferase